MDVMVFFMHTTLAPYVLGTSSVWQMTVFTVTDLHVEESVIFQSNSYRYMLAQCICGSTYKYCLVPHSSGNMTIAHLCTVPNLHPKHMQTIETWIDVGHAFTSHLA